MGDFLHVLVKNLGVPKDGPSWLWTVRNSAGKLISGGIEDSEDDAWEQARQVASPSYPHIEDDRPTGEW